MSDSDTPEYDNNEQNFAKNVKLRFDYTQSRDSSKLIKFLKLRCAFMCVHECMHT